MLGCTALVAAGVASTGALAAGSGRVPAKDSFSGRLASASGRYQHDGGNVSFALHVAKSGNVRITLSGRSCSHRANCLDLSGTLFGKLTRVPSNPDVGKSFLLSGVGTVKPLGSVSAGGDVHGTGSIVNGHETLRLTLTGSHGKVTVNAHSPLVPGFTSP
jgi:hypothetical protein